MILLDDWIGKHYASLGSVGEAMLGLIEGLRAALAETQVYTLTSHSTLCLMSVDDYDPVGWHVRIEPPWEGVFAIEYEALGSTDTLRLQADNPEEALELTLFAMRACGAWLPG